jgi:hypothetical protein
MVLPWGDESSTQGRSNAPLGLAAAGQQRGRFLDDHGDERA